MVTHVLGDGSVPLSIVGAQINFRFPLTDRYDNTNFVWNLTQSEVKAITSVVKDFAGRITGVAVAAIDDWIPTDRYALALNNTISQSLSLSTMFTAATDGDEIVLWPQITHQEPHAEMIPDHSKAVEVRGYSPLHKGWLFARINSSAQRYDFTHTSGTARLTDLIVLNMRAHNSAQHEWTTAGDIEIESCRYINLTDNTVEGPSCWVLNGTGTIKFFNCTFWSQRMYVAVSAGTPTIEFYNCLGVAARGAWKHVFNYEAADPGSMKIFNCAVVHKTSHVSSLTGSVATPAYDAASDFNWGPDTDVPGANSFQNTDGLLSGISHFDAPPKGTTEAERVLDTQMPWDWRPASRSTLKGLGNFFAGMSLRDINGHPRPTSGVQTIGPVNLESTNDGIPWDGLSAVSVPKASGRLYVIGILA